MPALSAEVASYIRSVKDNLTQGQDRPTRASIVLDGVVEFVVDDPGAAGNTWTLAVIYPDGAAALDATAVGQDVTLTLDGTGTAATVAGAAETYALTDADTLIVSVNGGANQTATFNTADFSNIALATAAEVAAVIDTDITGVDGVDDSGTIRINTDLTGSGASIEIVGGAAATKLGFTVGQTGLGGFTPDASANTGALIAAEWNANVTGVTAYAVGAGTAEHTTSLTQTSFSGGADEVDANSDAAAANFLRAQDLATVLELLQNALDQTTALTATGGTAISVQDTGAFTAGQQVGNYVTFTGNVTSSLAGITARVISNTTGALFFAAGALPEAPASGDTYTITGGIVEDAIVELREGGGLADAPAGNVYGDSRLILDAMVRFIRQLGGTVFEQPYWSGTCTSATTESDVVLELRGGSLRPGQLRGLKISVTGFAPRIVEYNDEDSVTIAPAFASAPAGGTAVAITKPFDAAGDLNHVVPYVAGHPNNYLFADLIGQLETRVIAYVLPT